MYLHNKDNYAHLMPKELPPDAYEHIIVYDTNPESLRQFPMVVISASSGKYQTAGLADVGHELYDNYGNEIGIMYCGILNFNLSIEVGTRTPLERETLVDIISSAMRFDIRRKLEHHNYLIYDANIGGENRINYTSQFIYTTELTFQVWSEWYDTFYYNKIDSVKLPKNIYSVTNKGIEDTGKEYNRVLRMKGMAEGTTANRIYTQPSSKHTRKDDSRRYTKDDIEDI
jgi:hypothetical protein